MEILFLENGKWKIQDYKSESEECDFKIIEYEKLIKLESLSTEELEHFEERAGIMQFDGWLSKEKAEEEALNIVLSKRFNLNYN